MQYAAAVILIHRPLAQFGKELSLENASAEISRQTCIEHACLIAQYVQQYSACHGSVMTMSWISLHIVATAATSLIANIAERRLGIDVDHQLDCLRKCLVTLNELEKSHVVTRRVRKVIQSAIRLLNIDAALGSTNLEWRSSTISSTPFSLPTATPSSNQSFPLINLLPSSNSQFDFLNSFESYFS